MSDLNCLRIEGDAQNPELVLLHGWGASSAVWQPVLDNLSQHFNLTCIDLPGHGGSPFIENKLHTAKTWARAALEVAPAKASWLGWSLGGLVAQCIASMAGDRVEKLILVASTCKFVAGDNWPEAMDEKTFSNFHKNVTDDPRGSLLRFIALQTRGSASASEDARQLRKTLLSPQPVAGAMDAGMHILLKADLRKQATHIDCPVLLLAGDRDTLVPVTAITAMQHIFVRAETQVIEHAGHAPFLSHPLIFVDRVLNFYRDSVTSPIKVNHG